MIGCGYCGETPAPEQDHVVARQFFPSDPKFRAGLPKVPVCSLCNRAKQKVEDVAGVILPFAHDSDASRAVITERIPRTLRRNNRLRTALQQGLKDLLLRRPSGVLVPVMGIELQRRELRDLILWFWWIARGLHRFESGVPVTPRQAVYLVHSPNPEHLVPLRKAITSYRSYSRSIGGGEFRYLFGMSANKELSAWLLGFKSMIVGAVIAGEDGSAEFHAALRRVQWCWLS